MKLFALAAAAGLALVSGIAPTAASAQPQVRERVVTRTVVREDRRGYRPRFRTVCRVRYRHGDRIRTCRRVRIYR
jgi:hypothetical protein